MGYNFRDGAPFLYGHGHDLDRPDRGVTRLLARLSSGFGVVVGVAGAAFVARTLAREWPEARGALADVDAFPMAAAGMLAVLAMVGIAWPWRDAIRLLGYSARRLTVVGWYFVGELGKYIPGGVWPILGRGELARRGGVPRPIAYGSTTLSLGAAYLGAMFTAVAILPFDLSRQADDPRPLAALAVLPIGLLALHPRVMRFVLHTGERLLKRPIDVAVPAWRESAALVLRYTPAWLAVAGSTWLVARALDPEASVVSVGFAAILSWIVGFLVVPVPGGLGVREAVFVAAAGLPSGIAAAIAVTSRVLFVAADAAGAAAGAVILRRGAVTGEAAPPPSSTEGAA